MLQGHREHLISNLFCRKFVGGDAKLSGQLLDREKYGKSSLCSKIWSQNLLSPISGFYADLVVRASIVIFWRSHQVLQLEKFVSFKNH